MADPAPDTEAVVSKQLHYYFSPSNLFRDKFLVKQQQENDGWVEIATLLKFNRLVTKGGTAENILAIAEQSDAFQVSEDKAKILGNTVAATKAEVEARSLYVKGFPKDDAVTTIEMIEEFFASHGTVLSVQIRRYKDKDGAWQPKGAAFVEFGTPEEAATVLAKVIPYEGVNLVFETVPAYWARKKEERDAAQKKRKEKKGGNRPLPEMPEYEEGIVIKGTNVGEGLNREDLKDAFGLYGNVAWVFFNRGEEEFHIKYKTAGGATTCLAQMGEAERTFGGVVAEISALNPEEERALLQASWAETHEKRRGKRGARGGGGGRGAKRKRDDDETEATAVAAGEAPATEEPAPKKAAAESSDGTPAKAPAPADA